MSEERAEIYGLYCPDTGALRYVGKARDAKERLKRHIHERGLRRPVNAWVRKLAEAGKRPVVRVLETVPYPEWEEAERRLIALHRQTANLLNVADGGAMPSQTAEQRRVAARAANKAMKADPRAAIATRYKSEMSKMLAQATKDNDLSWAATLRFFIRMTAGESPDLYGAWALSA